MLQWPIAYSVWHMAEAASTNSAVVKRFAISHEPTGAPPMLIDERRQQVKHILQEIKDLTPDARQRVMALDLPVFESLVMAELCRAHQLLTQDHSFDWKQR